MEIAQLTDELMRPVESLLPSGNQRSFSAGMGNLPAEGRTRVIIENVAPQVEGGRYPAKRSVGETVTVEADIFTDSHVLLSAVVKYKAPSEAAWQESPMTRKANDRWVGTFTVSELGVYQYSISAWVDHFKTWRDELRKKSDAGQKVALELLAGAQLIEAAAARAPVAAAERLRLAAEELRAASKDPDTPATAAVDLALDQALDKLVLRHSERAFVADADRIFRLCVDPERARFSAWYELFPRSFARQPGGHGTFQDCEAQLDRVAKMGFDVLYLPPIHPIGRSFRKGKNNNPEGNENDPGSPWAIGAAEGGHKAVHPQLGTLEDFRRLRQRAETLGIDIALDIAFQCSPDHPYLREHPGWFRKQADGSIAYAENPPKKYQDIYPFDFECDDWRGLWLELKSIFDFWIEQGVRIFRVDNPHTKSFAFWEWCVAALKQEHPDLIFLAEAFTRPAVMNRLAKLGFTQSYNYFPWRTSKAELTEYLTTVLRPPVSDFFRPNLWPNTPDILPEHLQAGGRTGFEIRLILAGTLGASYGIYGPAFELCEDRPLRPGTEEYLNSEKYEIRQWNLDAPGNLQDLIARVNRIRRENRAFHSNHQLTFHEISNDNLLAYTKATPDGMEVILTVVNLDPYRIQSGFIELPLEGFLDDPVKSYQMHDLLTGARFVWHGRRNYVELDPHYSPAHIFRLRRHVRTERDFDYFM